MTTTPTETLSARIRRAAQIVYDNTKRNPNNWIEHTHGPHDTADSCEVCKELGLTQKDWDRAVLGE